jgi:hypothetical protein
MSTLCKIESIFLELHLAVGSEASESSIRYVLNNNNFILKVPLAVDPMCCTKRFEYSQLAIQYMNNPNLSLVYIDKTLIKPNHIYVKPKRSLRSGFVSKSQKLVLLQIPLPST